MNQIRIPISKDLNTLGSNYKYVSAPPTTSQMKLLGVRDPELEMHKARAPGSSHKERCASEVLFFLIQCLGNVLATPDS